MPKGDEMSTQPDDHSEARFAASHSARLQLAPEPSSSRNDPERGAEFRAEVAANLRDAGATIAEVESGIAFVDAQLCEINVTLTRLKNHHRLMNVLTALVLTLTIVITWKVIGG
jgi:hypothetical protein